jgi:hypothetical protein
LVTSLSARRDDDELKPVLFAELLEFVNYLSRITSLHPWLLTGSFLSNPSFAENAI